MPQVIVARGLEALAPITKDEVEGSELGVSAA